MLGISANDQVGPVRAYDLFHVAILAAVPLIGLWWGFGTEAQVYAALCVAFGLEIHDTVAGQPLRAGFRDFAFRMIGGMAGVGLALLIG